MDESRLERDWNLNYYKAGSNQHNLGSNQLSAGSNIYLNPLQSFQSKQQRYVKLKQIRDGNDIKQIGCYDIVVKYMYVSYNYVVPLHFFQKAIYVNY